MRSAYIKFIKPPFALASWYAILLHPLFIALWCITALASAVLVDRSAALYFHHLPANTWLSFASVLTNLGYGKYYIFSFIATTVIAEWGFKQRDIARVSLFLLLCIVIPGGICDVIKVIASRARPVELFNHGLYGFQFFQVHARYWSFPSGHSTTISGLMMGVAVCLPRLRQICLLLMLSVAFTRVMVTAHFLSDVMMGLYLGAICMPLAALAAQRLLPHGDSNVKIPA